MGKTIKPPSKGPIRIQKMPLRPVLNHIGSGPWRVWVADWGKKIRVRMDGQRMQLLGRTQKCACCGLKGSYFWLESNGYREPHFNLYALKHGRSILMTMDHIVPKSKGGITSSENLQLLCSKCNQIKKDLPLTIEKLRERAHVL